MQYATAKVGAVLVNVNPAYRTHELAYALNQSGLRLLFSATEFKTSDYRAMVDEVTRRGTDALERVVFLGTDDWDDARRRRRGRCRRTRCAERMAHAGEHATRSTSSTPRARPASPRARR